MIRTLSIDSSKVLETGSNVAKCREKLLDSDTLIWVDIFDATDEESISVLKDVFKFHPLAIDDALVETHIPKIDNWGDYLTLVIQTMPADMQKTKEITTKEVDLFVGKNFLVSYHLTHNQAIDTVWEQLLKNKFLPQRNASEILYLIMDESASDFIRGTDYLDNQLNDLEDQLFDNPDPSLLEVIFSLKRGILHLRQSIGPQREVLNKLARGDYPMLGPEATMYFRDVYDHFLRLYDIIEALRDLTSNTLEIFLSVVNNRMNGIMKTLTIITTLFMPISFLAGFFGMNFFKPVTDLASWTSQPAFYVILTASILFPIGMLIYFIKKGWMR